MSGGVSGFKFINDADAVPSRDRNCTAAAISKHGKPRERYQVYKLMLCNAYFFLSEKCTNRRT